ncbi:MAG: transposase [bacterium]
MSDESRVHKGFYSRGYLPHIDNAELKQFITFRLADSLPVHLLAKWRIELASTRDEFRAIEMRRRVERYLDEGRGECILLDPRHANSVAQVLRYGDGTAYNLFGFTVMPNHVHVLIEQKEGFPLHRVVRSWKSKSSSLINQARGASEAVWQPDYFDRYIRSAEHFSKAVGYIQMNPVKAGLVTDFVDWPHTWIKANLET